MTRRRISIAVLAGGVVGAALWWRRHPSACPYSQRFWVESPHPFITRERLLAALNPRPGERILEVGPGTGYYTADVADAVGSTGKVDIFDLQPEMLAHTLRRTARRGLTNISATEGNAERLPYADEIFDGAYLVAVLGEIPDQAAALDELARVLKPGGRLVVGELFGDPHWVAPAKLRQRGEEAELRFEQRVGRLLGHYTVFVK